MTTTVPTWRTGRLLALLSTRRPGAARPTPKRAADLGKGGPGEIDGPAVWLAGLRLMG
ncbi:hypothetical protein [Streptomyces sp. NPDC127119]|uniref:hypothetical protein n=1 Tax=Streptomyces sp. NPDC127119 TaxID=3345370 RepID=UPI003626D308